MHLTRRTRAILATAVIAAATLAGAGSSATAAPTAPAAAGCSDHPTNILFNSGAGGIGVMHLWDGVYGKDGKQKYDAVVNGNSNTCDQFSWDEVRGFYIGPGACALVRFAANNIYPYQWSTYRKLTAGSRQISPNNMVHIQATPC
ncbi:hypothetical protein AB0F72_19790 [Actinoplanes sp. NPDC023936]|uniref:hypothetical protein n=1 Tax=Actinoplanes sp. NPDC023936 TaxID=3154910 RepID=UPI0033DDA67B